MKGRHRSIFDASLHVVDIVPWVPYACQHHPGCAWGQTLASLCVSGVPDDGLPAGAGLPGLSAGMDLPAGAGLPAAAALPGLKYACFCRLGSASSNEGALELVAAEVHALRMSAGRERKASQATMRAIDGRIADCILTLLQPRVQVGKCTQRYNVWNPDAFHMFGGTPRRTEQLNIAYPVATIPLCQPHWLSLHSVLLAVSV